METAEATMATHMANEGNEKSHKIGDEEHDVHSESEEDESEGSDDLDQNPSTSGKRSPKPHSGEKVSKAARR